MGAAAMLPAAHAWRSMPARCLTSSKSSGGWALDFICPDHGPRAGGTARRVACPRLTPHPMSCSHLLASCVPTDLRLAGCSRRMSNKEANTARSDWHA